VAKQPTQAESLPGERSEGGQVKKSEIVSVDDVWNKYINHELGFSIKVPKEVTHPDGACFWNEAEGDHSYRTEDAVVPIKIFEERKKVYVSTEYFYKLIDVIEEGGRNYYSDCKKVENSLEKLKDPEYYRQRVWEIAVGSVRSEGELDGFVKEVFGSGCHADERSPASQSGVFDVRIGGDYMDEHPKTTCFVNYGYVLKYFPEERKVVAWIKGHIVFTLFQFFPKLR